VEENGKGTEAGAGGEEGRGNWKSKWNWNRTDLIRSKASKEKATRGFESIISSRKGKMLKGAERAFKLVFLPSLSLSLHRIAFSSFPALSRAATAPFPIPLSRKLFDLLIRKEARENGKESPSPSLSSFVLVVNATLVKVTQIWIA